MKNILHAIDTAGPGGAESVFMALASGLNPKRYRSFVAVPSRGWLYDELCKRGFKPYVVGGRKGFDLGYLRKLVKIVRSQHIDIIQSHLFGSNVYCSLVGLLCRIPVVATFHGDVDVNRNDRLARLKFKIINWGASRTVFVSDHLARNLNHKRRLSLSNTMRIYNGVDAELYHALPNDTLRKQLGLEKNDIIVGAVGNIRPAKSYDVLIKAAALLKDSSPRYKVVISGIGDNQLNKELLELSRCLKLDKHVIFIGFQENVAMILNSLDIYVLSSSSEGFSISTLEAMACEVPVVVTRSGGPEEIVTDGVNGLLVDIAKPEQIADAIRKITGNSQLRKSLVCHARDIVLSKFSHKAMIVAYETLYAKLTNMTH